MIKIYKQKIEFESKNQVEFFDLTEQVQKIVDDSGVREGYAGFYAGII